MSIFTPSKYQIETWATYNAKVAYHNVTLGDSIIPVPLTEEWSYPRALHDLHNRAIYLELFVLYKKTGNILYSIPS